jgi:hypothetical protein
MITDTDTFEQLGKVQRKVARHNGYMGNLFPSHTNLVSAYNQATDLAKGASTPADATVIVGILMNTFGMLMAEKCVPLTMGGLNKLEIVKLLYGDDYTETMVIDFARPHSFDVECRANGIDPNWFVWHYPKDATFGKPLNLAEELINRIMS